MKTHAPWLIAPLVLSVVVFVGCAGSPRNSTPPQIPSIYNLPDYDFVTARKGLVMDLGPGRDDPDTIYVGVQFPEIVKTVPGDRYLVLYRPRGEDEDMAFIGAITLEAIEGQEGWGRLTHAHPEIRIRPGDLLVGYRLR